MPETERKELKEHQGRSNVAIHGGFSVVFSLPFILAGLAIILLAAGVIPAPASSFHAPRFVVGLVGGIFLAAGLLVLVYGIRSMRQTARVKEMLQRHPDEIWLADHPWNVREAQDDTLRRASGMFFGAAFLLFFLAPFNWWAFFSNQGNWFVTTVVLFFDAILLIVLGSGVYLLARSLKYGRSTLRFPTFPFFLGENLEAVFHTDRDIGFFRKLSFTLRCIQEQYETRGSGKNRQTVVVCYQLYADSMAIDEPGEHRQMGPEMRLSFPLPSGSALATCLRLRPPRYWEIEVKADTPGIDFGATFLVPVYGKPVKA